jgi:hypothetical protein
LAWQLLRLIVGADGEANVVMGQQKGGGTSRCKKFVSRSSRTPDNQGQGNQVIRLGPALSPDEAGENNVRPSPGFTRFEGWREMPVVTPPAPQTQDRAAKIK